MSWHIKGNQKGGVFGATVILLALMTIVIPNSIRLVSLPLFGICAGAALLQRESALENSTILLLWLATSSVTVFYLLLAATKGYTDAIAQVLFVYVISPALWLLICERALRLFSVTRVIRTIISLGMLAAGTVFAFYYVYLTFGSKPLEWLIAEPNVMLKGGEAEATMDVFGSLLFVSGGFFAAPGLVQGRAKKIFVATVLLAASLLSGRSALILAFVTGSVVNLAVQFSNRVRFQRAGVVSHPFVTVGVAVFLVTLSASTLDLDILKIFSEVVEKISQGGGPERTEQARSLVKGVSDSWLLGAGHGVGVSVVRSRFPWRYELLWLATLFRVGIFGILVYSIPFAIILVRYCRLLIRRKGTPCSDFVFGGFLATFIGSATNPYYESFEFQWMLVLPLAFFLFNGDANAVCKSRQVQRLSRDKDVGGNLNFSTILE